MKDSYIIICDVELGLRPRLRGRSTTLRATCTYIVLYNSRLLSSYFYLSPLVRIISLSENIISEDLHRISNSASRLLYLFQHHRDQKVRSIINIIVIAPILVLRSCSRHIRIDGKKRQYRTISIDYFCAFRRFMPINVKLHRQRHFESLTLRLRLVGTTQSVRRSSGHPTTCRQTVMRTELSTNSWRRFSSWLENTGDEREVSTLEVFYNWRLAQWTEHGRSRCMMGSSRVTLTGYVGVARKCSILCAIGCLRRAIQHPAAAAAGLRRSVL